MTKHVSEKKHHSHKGTQSHPYRDQTDIRFGLQYQGVKAALHWSKKTAAETAKTVKVLQKIGESSQHNDMTEKYFTINLHKSHHKHGKRKVQSYYTHQQSWLAKATGTGQQFAADIFNVGNIMQQLTPAASATASFTSTAQSASSNAWAVNPFDLNPGQRASGGVITNTGVVPVQDKVYWHNVSGEHQITNASNVTCTFSIYYLTPKIAIEGTTTDSTFCPSTAGPIQTLWTRALNDVKVNTLAAWDTPVQREADGTPAAPTAGTAVGEAYGVSPFRHRLVTKYAKILHCETHSLQPGATKKLKFKFNMNCVLDQQVLEEAAKNFASQPLQFLPGKSVMTYMIARGCPVKINVGAGPGFTYEGCAPGPIQLLNTVNYTCSFSYFNTPARVYNEIVDYNYPRNLVASEEKIINDTDEMAEVVTT